jgi:hypothetical protein
MWVLTDPTHDVARRIIVLYLYLRFVLRQEIAACTLTYVRAMKHRFQCCPEACCCKAWQVKIGLSPIFMRDVSRGPSSDRMQKCMATLLKIKI